MIWHLLPTHTASGAVQMALDEWLLNQQPQTGHSYLRFYQWSEPTISLGYHQRRFPEAWKSLRYQGKRVPLVRRPTGGRAVLHQGELTYAVVTAGGDGSRRQRYEALCQFLIEGWENLGVPLTFGTAKRSYRHSPNCFETATAADLVMADGVKLIGSAQVYRNGAVLQHGSMRLWPDALLHEQVFGTKMKVPDLPSAIGMDSVDEIIDSLVAAASICFHADLEWVEWPVETHLPLRFATGTPPRRRPSSGGET